MPSRIMVMEDGRRKKLYVFVMVLGYSRMMYAQFTTSSKLPVLLRCLAGAFRALGLPSELLVDNMKQAVEKHDVTTGTVHWNPRFLDLVEHHEILPVASPPYWPRVKGKVERGVGYVKQSFLEGRTFTDLDDLNRQLELWLDTVANVRVHGTTGERPVDRHQQELRHLRSSAAIPAYDTGQAYHASEHAIVVIEHLADRLRSREIAFTHTSTILEIVEDLSVRAEPMSRRVDRDPRQPINGSSSSR